MRRKLVSVLRRRMLLAGISTVGAMVAVCGSPAGASAAALPPGCSQSGQIVSCSVTFTSGSNPFTVPAGVSSIHVVAVGGMGGSGGGYGARVTGDLAVNGGSTLYAVVASNGGFQTAGTNGGGPGGEQELCVAENLFCGQVIPGGGGGGASDVRASQNDPASRLLVAAGGGGDVGGGAGGGHDGAGGGGPTGIDDLTFGGGGGAGGSMTNGGAGGDGGVCSLSACVMGGGGGTGSVGVGGSGGNGGAEENFGLEQILLGGSGGGGGGGLFGGGGGGGGGIGAGGAGGGGSNLVPPGGSQSVDTTGVPLVQISYELVPTSKAQCMNGGWLDFPQFKNQGDCVSFVQTGK